MTNIFKFVTLVTVLTRDHRGYAVGLGTLCLDGFVSMDAGSEGGILTTKTFKLKGDTLYINADASRGDILVELVDESGRIIVPFSLANCPVITTDSICHPVVWRGVTNLKQFGDRSVRVRFYLNKARLYAFWKE